MSKDDIVVANLPHGAGRSSFSMLRQFGRDQVASAIANGTWESFESPFPTHYYACARTWTGLIVDVGANTGFYSLLGACASVDNEVVAFEPDPAIMQALKENLALSNVVDSVSCSSLALSSKPGRAIFYVPTQEHGLIETSSSLEAGFKPTHSEKREIDVETLDGFLSRSPFIGKPISLIKVDVEGHECPVLTGATETVQAWRPILFVEVLGHADTAFLNEFVRSNDYVDIPLSPRGPSIDRDGVRFIGDAWNHAFVPSERASEFLAMAV